MRQRLLRRRRVGGRLRPNLDPGLPHHVVKGWAGNSYGTCRQGYVPLGPVERIEKEILLEIPARLTVAEIPHRTVSKLQVLVFDGLGAARDGSPVEAIFEFTDVSRPSIGKDEFFRA